MKMKILDLDIIKASSELGPNEIRYIVDLYYQIQDYRISSNNQAKALERSEEPNYLISSVKATFADIESDIKAVLTKWAKQRPEGEWLNSISGIGPVISAGLMSYLRCADYETVGHIWSYAGLLPEHRRRKGQRISWNPKVKTLCWKIGESFVKVQNRDSDIYGQVYVARKALETERNERGEYAEQAKQILEEFNYERETATKAFYESGKLPPSHIHARAKRYAVKLFLSHYHHVCYELAHGKAPPYPYVIEHLGHVDYIAPPNFKDGKVIK